MSYNKNNQNDDNNNKCIEVRSWYDEQIFQMNGQQTKWFSLDIHIVQYTYLSIDI